MSRRYNRYGKQGPYEQFKGMIYQCVRCKLKFSGDKLAERQNLKCIKCGYKVLKKVRPPRVKRLKAE